MSTIIESITNETADSTYTDASHQCRTKQHRTNVLYKKNEPKNQMQ